MEVTSNNFVLISKCEVYFMAGLAIMGAIAVVKSIAQNSYMSGRQDKEREMKRDLKKRYGKKIEL